MKSRMEKYYNISNDSEKRTKLNETLYREIYEDVDYTNIEGIANIEKTNEIDINKIKEMLRSHIEANSRRTNSQLVKDIEPQTIQPEEPKEEKNYDIRDVLNKAKDEREHEPKEYYSLKNTQYDILKGLNIKNYNNELDDETELKELINTITSTSMLNKMGDNELSLNMFSELQSLNDTSIKDKDSIMSILEEKPVEEHKEEKEEIDRSFYTSSLNFKEKDFDELKDINVSLKKSNRLIKITLIILFLIIAGAITYIILNFIK